MLNTNLNEVLTKLINMFGNKEMTLTTHKGQIKACIKGFWCSHDNMHFHFVLVEDVSETLFNIAIPINLSEENDHAFLPIQFGSSFANAIDLPEVKGIPSFLNSFRKCLD